MNYLNVPENKLNVPPNDILKNYFFELHENYTSSSVEMLGTLLLIESILKVYSISYISSFSDYSIQLILLNLTFSSDLRICPEIRISSMHIIKKLSKISDKYLMFFIEYGLIQQIFQHLSLNFISYTLNLLKSLSMYPKFSVKMLQHSSFCFFIKFILENFLSLNENEIYDFLHLICSLTQQFLTEQQFDLICSLFELIIKIGNYNYSCWILYINKGTISTQERALKFLNICGIIQFLNFFISQTNLPENYFLIEPALHLFLHLQRKFDCLIEQYDYQSAFSYILSNDSINSIPSLEIAQEITRNREGLHLFLQINVLPTILRKSASLSTKEKQSLIFILHNLFIIKEKERDPFIFSPLLLNQLVESGLSNLLMDYIQYEDPYISSIICEILIHIQIIDQSIAHLIFESIDKSFFLQILQETLKNSNDTNLKENLPNFSQFIKLLQGP